MEVIFAQGPEQGCWKGSDPECFHSDSMQADLPSLLNHQPRQSKCTVTSFAGSDSFSHGRGLEVEEEFQLENPGPSR